MWTQREADSIIFYMYTQMRLSGIIDLVVIDTEDLGVVVLSAFVAHQTDGSLAMKLK